MQQWSDVESDSDFGVSFSPPPQSSQNRQQSSQSEVDRHWASAREASVNQPLTIDEFDTGLDVLPRTARDQDAQRFQLDFRESMVAWNREETAESAEQHSMMINSYSFEASADQSASAPPSFSPMASFRHHKLEAHQVASPRVGPTPKRATFNPQLEITHSDVDYAFTNSDRTFSSQASSTDLLHELSKATPLSRGHTISASPFVRWPQASPTRTKKQSDSSPPVTTPFRATVHSTPFDEAENMATEEDALLLQPQTAWQDSEEPLQVLEEDFAPDLETGKAMLDEDEEEFENEHRLSAPLFSASGDLIGDHEHADELEESMGFSNDEDEDVESQQPHFAGQMVNSSALGPLQTHTPFRARNHNNGNDLMTPTRYFRAASYDVGPLSQPSVDRLRPEFGGLTIATPTPNIPRPLFLPSTGRSSSIAKDKAESLRHPLTFAMPLGQGPDLHVSNGSSPTHFASTPTAKRKPSSPPSSLMQSPVQTVEDSFHAADLYSHSVERSRTEHLQLHDLVSEQEHLHNSTKQNNLQYYLFDSRGEHDARTSFTSDIATNYAHNARVSPPPTSSSPLTSRPVLGQRASSTKMKNDHPPQEKSILSALRTRETDLPQPSPVAHRNADEILNLASQELFTAGRRKLGLKLSAPKTVFAPVCFVGQQVSVIIPITNQSLYAVDCHVQVELMSEPIQLVLAANFETKLPVHVLAVSSTPKQLRVDIRCRVEEDAHDFTSSIGLSPIDATVGVHCTRLVNGRVAFHDFAHGESESISLRLHNPHQLPLPLKLSLEGPEADQFLIDDATSFSTIIPALSTSADYTVTVKALPTTTGEKDLLCQLHACLHLKLDATDHDSTVEHEINSPDIVIRLPAVLSIWARAVCPRIQVPRMSQTIVFTSSLPGREVKTVPLRNPGTVPAKVTLTTTGSPHFHIHPAALVVQPDRAAEFFIVHESSSASVLETAQLVLSVANGQTFRLSLRATNEPTLPTLAASMAPAFATPIATHETAALSRRGIVVETNHISFGGVMIGVREIKSLLISNSGRHAVSLRLRLERPTIGFEFVGAISASRSGVVKLQSNSHSSFDIGFQPLEYSDVQSTLFVEVMDEATGGLLPVQKVLLTGRGGKSNLALSHATSLFTPTRSTMQNRELFEIDIPVRDGLASLSLENRGDRAAFVRVIAPAHVRARISPDSVIIASGAERTVSIEIPVETLRQSEDFGPLFLVTGDELDRRRIVHHKMEAKCADGVKLDQPFDGELTSHENRELDLWTDVARTKPVLPVNLRFIQLTLRLKITSSSSADSYGRPSKRLADRILGSSVTTTARTVSNVGDEMTRTPRTHLVKDEEKHTVIPSPQPALNPQKVVVKKAAIQVEPTFLKLTHAGDRGILLLTNTGAERVRYEIIWPALRLDVTPGSGTILTGQVLQITVQLQWKDQGRHQELPSFWEGKMFVLTPTAKTVVHVQCGKYESLASTSVNKQPECLLQNPPLPTQPADSKLLMGEKINPTDGRLDPPPSFQEEILHAPAMLEFGEIMPGCQVVAEFPLRSSVPGERKYKIAPVSEMENDAVVFDFVGASKRRVEMVRSANGATVTIELSVIVTKPSSEKESQEQRRALVHETSTFSDPTAPVNLPVNGPQFHEILIITPASAKFPKTRVGDVSSLQLTVTNTSRKDVCARVLTPSSFACQHQQFIIHAESFVHLTVQFIPQRVGKVQGYLILSVSDDEHQAIRIPLNGSSEAH